MLNFEAQKIYHTILFEDYNSEHIETKNFFDKSNQKFKNFLVRKFC